MFSFAGRSASRFRRTFKHNGKEGSLIRSQLADCIIGISILLICAVCPATGQLPPMGTPMPAQTTSVPQDIKAPQREPIHIAGTDAESRLIHKVEPVYPQLALKVRVEGKAKLAVTINEEGFVYDVRVVSGHMMLKAAAIDAVKQWQFSPTLLNGVPVPIVTTVTVIFIIKQAGWLP